MVDYAPGIPIYRANTFAHGQTMNHASPILSAQLLEISGADAIGFAQSQFSSNLLSLADGQWQAGAWLDPQGRVRYLLQLARMDAQHLVILLRGGDAVSLAQALRPYIFRSKVQITARTEPAIGSGPALAEHTIHLDPQSGELHWGFGDYSMTAGSEVAGDPAWLQRQVQAGWPWLPEAAQGTHVGPALSLHRLGGLAIDKGCYPGQEIVARLHYRGGLKRHLALLEAQQAAAPAESLQSGETPAGQLLNPFAVARGEPVLAVLNDEIEPTGFLVRQRWAP